MNTPNKPATHTPMTKYILLENDTKERVHSCHATGLIEAMHKFESMGEQCSVNRQIVTTSELADIRHNSTLPVQNANLKAENAKLREALENFLALDRPDANHYNEGLRVKFLTQCPEYVGYLKQAKTALSRP